jgi:hypothetical protein
MTALSQDAAQRKAGHLAVVDHQDVRHGKDSVNGAARDMTALNRISALNAVKFSDSGARAPLLA